MADPCCTWTGWPGQAWTPTVPPCNFATLQAGHITHGSGGGGVALYIAAQRLLDVAQLCFNARIVRRQLFEGGAVRRRLPGVHRSVGPRDRALQEGSEPRAQHAVKDCVVTPREAAWRWLPEQVALGFVDGRGHLNRSAQIGHSSPLDQHHTPFGMQKRRAAEKWCDGGLDRVKLVCRC